MLLLAHNRGKQSEGDSWSAHVAIPADAGEVLRTLTDPELIATWAPVDFDLERTDGSPLQAGRHERVSGSIAGLSVSFGIEVIRADRSRLELLADGPVTFEVEYRFRQRKDSVAVDASVGIRRKGGLAAQVLRAAAGALLSAGALDHALQRLEESVCKRLGPELAAA
jgi:hypothetical protein